MSGRNEAGWPEGQGEMAFRIRSFDWSATPLGPIDRWPPSLRTAVDIVVHSAHAMQLAWGPGRNVLYNDAYAPMLGGHHPRALGVPFREAWPDIWADIGPLVDRVFAGETLRRESMPLVMTRHGHPEDTWWDFSYSPVRDEAGAVAGLLNVTFDATDREYARRAEAELRESEERQAYLLKLSDALRPLADPAEIQGTASRILGQHLRANRVCYVEISDAESIVRQDYTSGVRSIVGKWKNADFGRAMEDALRSRRVNVENDIQKMNGLSDAERANYAAIGVAAQIVLTLFKDDRWVANFGVHSATPRVWTRQEIFLAEQTAERTWAAVERARAEAALRQSEEGLRMALEAGRMGTYRFDVHTGIEQWDDNEYALLGLKPNGEQPTRELFFSLVHPDDLHLVQYTPDDERPPGTALDSEFRIIRPDNGEVRYLTAHALVRFGPDGRPVELIGVNQDVTDERRALEAQRATEERMQQFGRASSDVLWIRDVKTLQWEYLSPAFDHIYGLTRQDALRADNFHTWLSFILPEDREAARTALERVAEGERVAFEYRIRRPDGDVRWLRNTDFPIHDQLGRVTHIAGVGSDITAMKRADEHQRLLAAELQHRVRNTLAVIRSIARRTAETSDSVEDLANNLQGRIDAFARVQSVVTRDPTRGVDVANLVAEELRAASAHEGRAVRVSGPDLGVRAKAAETLALGIHELVTNAIKHGALQRDGAYIDVTWAREGGRVLFRWKESGVPMVGSPARVGLGTEILTRSMPYELRGRARLEVEADGIFYELSLPEDVLFA